MHAFFLSFITVASLQFLALVAPGPDFVLVTRNALLYPREVAIYTAFGIALGLSVHISYCIFGLAIVITHALWIFHILKYLGAIYLIYIGIKSWCAATPLPSDQNEIKKNATTLTRLQAFYQGILCNLLNPKAGLFFLGLFTLVIKPSTPLWQQGIYGVWMVLVTATWFSYVVYWITRSSTRQKIYRIQPLVIKILGGLLVLMGVVLLFVSV